jgi:putative ABC transport system permease protein
VGCWASQIDAGIEPWQATVGPAGFLVLAVAVPMVCAAAAPLLIARVAPAAARTRRASIVLAFADLVRDPARAGVMAVALASPIVVGFATDGFVTSATSGVERSLGDAVEGVSVSTVSVDGGGDGFLAPEQLDALAALPGAGAVHRGAFISVGNDAGSLIGVEAFEDGDLESVDVVLGSADRARLDAGEVLIGPGLARRTGARPGDLLELATPTGVVEVPVQGVRAESGFGGYSVTMAYGSFTALYGDRSPAFVVVEPEPGVTSEALADTIRRAAKDIDPAIEALTPRELVDEIAASIGRQMAPFRAMQLSLQVVAFVAVLSTLLLASYQRRREHGMLAAVGARPPDLGRLVLSQAGVVGVAAAAWAVVGAPIVLWGMLQVIPLMIGRHNPFDPDWVAIVPTAAVGVVVALLGGLWPARRAARVDVIDALRYE